MFVAMAKRKSKRLKTLCEHRRMKSQANSLRMSLSLLGSHIRQMRRSRHYENQMVRPVIAFAVIATSLLLWLIIITAPVRAQSRVLAHPEISTLPSKEKRWALIIGIDKYEDDNITPLLAGANDANALAHALKDYAGFNENQIIVLTDEQPKSRQPTRLNILRYLSNLKRSIPKDGLFLISFSGHGIEREGRAFLIPSDAIFTEDIKFLQQTAISVEDIRQDIKDTSVGQVIILLDAC